MALRLTDLTHQSSLNSTDDLLLSITSGGGSRRITASEFRTSLLAGGAAWGLTDYLSLGDSPADAGTIRLPNNITIAWRNAAGNANKTLKLSATDLFTFDAGLSVTGTTTSTAFSGPLTGNVTGNVSGSSSSCTGNAASATVLQTARAINGVSFDGSAPITVTAAAGTLSGNTLNATVLTSSLTSVGTLTGGTWNATAIGPTFGGTGQTAYAAGDILYASGVNTLSRLAKGSDTQVLTLSGGVPIWQTPSSSYSNRCLASKTADQTISTGLLTAITFDEEKYDTNSMHDPVTNNSRITVPSGGNAGYYVIIGQVQFNGNATGQRYLQLKKNGADFSTVVMHRVVANGTQPVVLQVVFIDVAPSVSDYYELFVFHDVGSNLDISSTGDITFFSVTQMS